MSAAPAMQRRDESAQDVTSRLASWVASLRLEDIPAEVRALLKTCVLDALGCGLYGSAQPWGRMAGDVAVALGGVASSSLFGRPEKVAPHDAALANGTAVHGFEIDDVHVASSFHPAAVTLPAALALAESEGASGERFIAALAAGYEIGIRLGIAAGVSHSTSGYHVTGTVGSVGAAAAAARLLGLDAGATLHAIAIGATQAAGLYAARKDAMAKRLHAGRAAQSGVIAALLAARGFTGSRVAIEAPFGGFLSTLNGQHPAESMLDGLGTHWETARVGFKVHAACASAHTSIDAVAELMERGLSAENIAQLTIRMSRKGALNVGWPYVPSEVVSAQMNGSYAAAMQLCDGLVFVDQFRPDRLADPAVLRLIEKISIVHDPELDLGGAAKRHCVRVSARLDSGEVLETTVENRRGSAERPLSAAEIEEKFHRLVAGRLPAGSAEAIMTTVAELERQPGLAPLTGLLSDRA